MKSDLWGVDFEELEYRQTDESAELKRLRGSNARLVVVAVIGWLLAFWFGLALLARSL